MYKLKEVTPRSWLVSSTTGNYGLLSKNNKNEYILLTKKGLAKFGDQEEVCNKLGKEIFNKVIKIKEVDKENYIKGYPTDFKNPWPVDNNELNTDLPVYTKNETGSVVHCAGYYVIHFPKGPIHSFCPKFETLEKYNYEGPFKTELEMKTVLSQMRKKLKNELTR